MPEEAPVTSATCPVRSKEGSAVTRASRSDKGPPPQPSPACGGGSRRRQLHALPRKRGREGVGGWGWAAARSRRFPRALAQRVFLNLASRCLWQRTEDDM